MKELSNIFELGPGRCVRRRSRTRRTLALCAGVPGNVSNVQAWLRINLFSVAGTPVSVGVTIAIPQLDVHFDAPVADSFARLGTR